MQIPDITPWTKPLLRILGEIARRVNEQYTAEQSLGRIREQIGDDGFVLYLAIDTTRWRVERENAVCGMATVQLTTDELDHSVAIISRGWIAPGYNGQPFDLTLPMMEDWAKKRGCREIYSITERQSNKGQERAINAYTTWIGKRGFRRRATLFSKSLR